PVARPIRRIPLPLEAKVRIELERLVNMGVLQPVESSKLISWCTPIVIVRKQNEEIRICGDFKTTLNEVIPRDHYTIPSLDSLLVKLSGSSLFSVIDLKDAFNQIPIEEDSQSLLTIGTPYGYYKYTRLPFGLSVAPNLFQRVMDDLLRDIPNVAVYLDDIIVLERLNKAGFCIKEQKLTLAKSEIRYLGMVLDRKGLRPDGDKLKCIRNMPKPTNVKQLKSFLVRWAWKLSAYDYDIEYRSGSTNIVADALSRLPVNDFSSDHDDKVIASLLTADLSKFKIQKQELIQETSKDYILSRILVYVQNGWPTICTDPSLVPYFQRRTEIQLVDGLLLFNGRLIIPSCLRERTLKTFHEGHLGTNSMKSWIRYYTYWPKIDEDVVRFIKLCAPCQRHRNAIPEVQLSPWYPDVEKGERISIDIAGPMDDKKFWVVIVDAHTKWAEIQSVSSVTSTRIIRILRAYFVRFGYAREVLSDNGPQFRSLEFKQFLERYGITHIKATPYHPRTNGGVERAIQTFKRRYYAAREEGLSPEDALADVIFDYRNSVHSATNLLPANLMFGRNLKC
ncbi:unnamed protein product, partial [Acanthocheilonema viteae]